MREHGEYMRKHVEYMREHGEYMRKQFGYKRGQGEYIIIIIFIII